MPCLVVERVPGPERVRTDSQAIISVSPYVYYDGDDKLDSGVTDMARLTKLEYLVEGQSLGNAEGVIAKITDDRIMLTDVNGYLLTLPNKVPEIDPIEKERGGRSPGPGSGRRGQWSSRCRGQCWWRCRQSGIPVSRKG